MAMNPFEDLKGFAIARPPLVVFVICLSLFGVVLMSLAFYVNDNENIRNPDITQDWNVFLENFADIEFCIVEEQNETVTATTTTTTTTVATTTAGKQNKEIVTTPESDVVIKNYSVSMLMTVLPTREFISIPHNVTFLSGAIPASHVGLKGIVAEELINVTMHLPYEWNTTKCHRTSCEPVQIYTCVHFQAAASVFPESKSPDMCESVNDTGIEHHARIMSQAPKNMFTSYYCRSRPVVKVHYKLNPRLTVWLSIRDHTVINLHLMHTSYFLFVMVVMILFYALFNGRSLSAAYAQAEKNTSHLTSSI